VRLCVSQCECLGERVVSVCGGMFVCQCVSVYMGTCCECVWECV
jgi:hypothetical protein